MRILTILVGCIFIVANLHAQMTVNGNILYGNEWINYNKEYHKIYIDADGVYQISYQTLDNAGVPVNTINGADFQLYAMGEEVPVYTSANGTLGSNDYIEFYAEKNKGAMDTHLYSSPQDQFNPYHSVYTDTLTYFLTWDASSNNKRLENTPNDLNNPPAAETHFSHESYQILGNKFNKGQAYSGIYESTFSPGEGFGGDYLVSGNYEVDTDHAYPAGGDAQFWIRFASESAVTHNITLSVNNTPLTIDSASYFDYRFRQISQPLATGSLSATTTVELTGMNGSWDKHAVSFVRIKYPREFKFANQNIFEFNIPGETNVEKYLEITDFDHGGIPPVLYDLTNGLRLITELTGNLIRVVLPASDTKRELVLINPNAVNAITGMLATNFTNFETTQSDYLIVSHPKFIDDPSGIIQTYSNYRATTGFTPIIINVEELYDQFAYGINKHAQAIRNFTGFSLENWAVQPKYMFMIGKSRPYFSTRKNPLGQPSYTPTFGHDPSDNLLTATPQSDIPRIAFGRIPVLSADEIAIYYEKIVAYENAHLTLPQTLEDRARLKRVMHLGGGDPLIETVIRNNFGNYKNVIEGPQVGGDVTSFFRENDEPLETSPTLALDSLIDNGVNLMTFYGHSSPVALDFNIDNPNAYNNQGRYFNMFSMGCYGGQVHQKTRNISEEFVFADQKGAVSFLATGGLSGLGALDMFADQFYDKLSNEKYGEGIGDIIQAAIADIEANNATIVNKIVYQQMTLNGDPALKLNYTTEPDYIVNEPTISFAPEILTNRDDIALTFTVTNIGRAIEDQFTIRIERILPDGSEIIAATETVDAPSFEKEYTLIMDAIGNGGGLNQFRITIDADNDITELPNPVAEENNTVLTEIFILTDVVRPLSPYDFAIEGDAGNIVLQAAIDADFPDAETYYIEIDTTALFDSPLKQDATITQSGGLLEWTPNMSYVDSTVYYWRVQVEDGSIPDTPGWLSSSFIFLDGEYPGWNQSHFYQFQKDELIGLDYGASRRFEFVNNFTEIAVNNAHYPILPSNQIDYSVNSSRIYDVENCELEEQGMYVVLFDENMSPFDNYQINAATDEGLYNSQICKSSAPVFLYPTATTDGQDKLKNFFENELPYIPNISYVLIYSLNDYLPETWDAALFSVLNTYGATALQNTSVTGGVPYAGVFDLNAGTAEEVLGDSLNAIIDAIFLIEGSWDNGRIRSTPIDLDNFEQSLSLDWKVNELEANDEAFINVYGLAENNEETLLIEGITDSPYYMEEIDPALYSRIRLEYVISDETNQTAPQLEYWRVLDQPCIKLSLKALLEGPYNAATGEMSTELGNVRRLLPGQTPVSPYGVPTQPGQPYSIPPWNYPGTEGNNFTDNSYSEDVVDWVLISVRTGINSVDEIAQAAALLLKDGTVSTMSQCAIKTDETNPLYIVLEHRNHLSIMTSEPVSLIDNELTYDFSLQNSYTDLTGTGQKEIAAGLWMMYSGDMSQIEDNVSYDINAIDKIRWILKNGLFDSYLQEDLNMDGNCNGIDKVLWDLNNGLSSRVPR